jgi:hypothetical protein
MSLACYQPAPLRDPAGAAAPTDWVWDGLLARGDVVLLTSFWKAGKTTLVAGLLDALDAGRPFLGRATVPAHTVVVTEESRAHWEARMRVFPGGERARRVSRPFPGRLTSADWAAFVRAAEDDRSARPLDLFVVDPLAHFLPGHSDSDPRALLDFLHPLRQLAEGGTAVLVLHHPRKKPSEDGSAARGSGVLLGYVDATLEVTRYGRLASDANRHRLTVRSRHPDAPDGLVYEWVPRTPEFRVVADGPDARFRENWELVRLMLENAGAALTVREVLEQWPDEFPAPTRHTAYDWLLRGYAERLVRRSGSGTKGDPFRFALPRKPLDPRDLPPLTDW